MRSSMDHALLFIYLILLLPRLSRAVPKNPLDQRDQNAAVKACRILNESFPHLVSFPGSSQYSTDIDHYAAASIENSTCTIEPASSGDVGEIIKIIGRSNIRAPFAIKSCGHAYVPGHSSTLGVQISMARFTNINVNKEENTVTIGVGNTWDTVYEQLSPLGLTVTGGRIPGVGVGGLSLGGGYSWITNEYGLVIDNILSHELILPNGTKVSTSSSSNPDLFFALKGGLNNFGIVTEITLKAIPQVQIYGGRIIYSGDVLDQVIDAASNFSNQNTDTKAQMQIIFIIENGQLTMDAQFCYNSPIEAPELFIPFLSIPSNASDMKLRTINDLVSSFGGTNLELGPFGFVGHVIPITKYSRPLLEEMVSQAFLMEQRLKIRLPDQEFFVHIVAEPFINPNAYSLGGAYAHPSDRPVGPASPEVFYASDPTLTLSERSALYNEFAEEIQAYSKIIQGRAVKEGLSRWDDLLYSNYALQETPLELLYGENVPRLRRIAAEYDPEKVMTLTGGFRLQ